MHILYNKKKPFFILSLSTAVADIHIGCKTSNRHYDKLERMLFLLGNF